MQCVGLGDTESSGAAARSKSELLVTIADVYSLSLAHVGWMLKLVRFEDSSQTVLAVVTEAGVTAPRLWADERGVR
jgi:hypothetical protein